MNRIKAYCPSCDTRVELYKDHFVVAGADWRCGNCFENFSDAQVDKLEAAEKALQDLEAKRQAIIEAALRR